MKNLENIKIKKTFLYNNDLYKEIERKQIRKLLTKLIIFVLIMVIFAAILIFILKADNRTNILNKIAFISFSICFIDFFPLFYYFLIFVISLKNDYLYHGKVYVITNDNKFYDMKFTVDYNYAKYNPDRNIIKTIIDLIHTDISIKNDNKNISEKVLNNNIDIKDLYSCLEIVNVYSIKEYYNRFEIECDCIEKISGEVYINETCTIYKCFDEYEKIYNFLKEKNVDNKVILENKNIKNNHLKNFALQMQKNKSIYFITLILPFLMPKESLYTCFTILFFIYFGNIYISKKALKEEIEVIEEKRLKKYVLFNIIIMIACLILSIIFTIIYKIKMINLIFSYALLCFFSVMIILMFKNKKKYN